MLNTKIDRLMAAMAAHEGFYPAGHPQYPNGSRAYRNHNPGNLRKSPFAYTEIDGYAVFRNDMVGWNAFQWDLVQKAKGNTSTGLNGESTLKELIAVWAPPEDKNDTSAYLNAVLRMTGFSEDMKLKELLEA